MRLRYYPHTGVKHKILGDYLKPWTRILGTTHHCVCYFDGFAGPGRYDDQEGSPLIAIEHAQSAPQHVRRVVCVNVEKDRRNYDNLVAETKKREGEQLQVIEMLPADIGNGVRRFARPPITGPRVVVINLHGSFAEAATSLLAASGKWPPTLFFIDPIGITGVPFAVVQGLLRLPQTEVMFTFMVQAARRFLDLPHLQPGLVSLFSTEECLRIRDELGLLGLYMQQLKQSGPAQWVWPFRVMETRRRETLYYLIHASNHFLAFKIIKGIMWAAGAQGEFAFLGPDDQAAREQLALFPDEWLEPFKDWLMRTFAGRTRTFEEVMRETYDRHNLIEKHYRQALLSLERERKARIRRLGERRRGGLKDDDLITFSHE